MARIEKLSLKTHEAADYREEINPEGWVDYGADNLFPQHLLELYHQSPTHTALCNSIAHMIYGDGFMPEELNSRIAFDTWDMADELRKCCLDLKIQGGFALEVLWSKGGDTIANVSHLPFENLRACEADDSDMVSHYIYSTDWADPQCDRIHIPCFNVEVASASPRQVLYVSPFSPGSFYYPKPDYIGALNYIELEKEIGEYHINNIQNGLSPSFSIHFKNGIPPIEERNEIRREIEAQMTGARGAGKVWITYSDLPEQKPDFEPIALSDADKQYQFLSEECTNKIMVGHRVTNPMMFGVLTAGKLGGGTEMEVSDRIFNDNVVEPMRRVVKESVQVILRGINMDSRINMSAKVDLSAAVDFLNERGEVLGDEWELIDTREVQYELEDILDAAWKFASVPMATPDQDSEQDSDIIRVRYAYAPEDIDMGTKGPSRDFCRQMIAAGQVYRKEDIIAAGSQAVNAGFGPNGSATYSIWEFKGGPWCFHFWERRTYLRKDNSRISVNEARAIITALPPEERADRRLPENPRNVAKRPRDMTNNGYL